MLNKSPSELYPLDFAALDSQLGAIQPIPFLVADFIPLDAATILFGEDGIGKSYLLTHLAIHLSQGWDWLGRTVKLSKVLFLDWEDTDTVFRNRVYQLTKEAPPKFSGNLVYKAMHQLVKDSEDGNYLGGTMKMFLEVEKPDVIIIDSVGQSISGHPSEPDTVNNYMRLLKSLPGTLILNDHNARDSNLPYGSRYKEAGARAVLQDRLLARQPGGITTQLELIKANYSPAGQKITCQIQFIPVATPVQYHVDIAISNQITSQNTASLQVAAAFKKLGPSSLRDIIQETGLSKSVVYREVSALEGIGQIKEITGKQRGQIYRWV